MKKLKIGKAILDIEVAKTASEHQKGLSGRKKIPKNYGMLFQHPKEKILSFWMKDTSIPLSIAFIGKDGNILEILDLEPFDETPVKSKNTAKWALEVNRGWFRENGVRTGDVINIKDFACDKLIKVKIVK